MQHEQLWAPWRLDYIKGKATSSSPRELSFLPDADRQCFICQAVADDCDHDRENLVVLRGETTITIINRYPYNNGHLMVAPCRHKARLDALSPDEQLECVDQMGRLVTLLETVLHAEGFNVGLNLGKAAGAGLPGHIHWHIVPRWSGDTNFMPVLAGVRTIPQALDALWEALSTHT